jgi:transcription elongation factor SPT6
MFFSKFVYSAIIRVFVTPQDDDDDGDENRKKKVTGGLEDSDDEDSDDEDLDKSKSTKRLKRNVDVLDDDDLDLINEARGLPTKASRELAVAADSERSESMARKEAENQRVKGRNEQELSRGLFTGDTDDEDDNSGKGNGISKPKGGGGGRSQQQQKQRQQQQLLHTEYDEEDMDDFIDPGEDGVRGVSEGLGESGVSEFMLQEHLDIFGTDFVDFMGDDKDNDGGGGVVDDDDDILDESEKNQRRKYRERGVGVDYGVDSGEEIEDDSDSDDDDDADLFGEDDIDEDIGDKQRSEVLKLKREKRRVAKEESLRQRRERVEAKRRAALRRAFEPVQLIENFCTERDEAIRMVDCPERYYDWLQATPSTPAIKKQRAVPKISDEITEEEEEEAFWIMQKIPAIHLEWLSFSSPCLVTPGENTMQTEEHLKRKESAVLSSIIYALRYMRSERLEPEFIRRYRQDVVSSPAVRNNLYSVIDEDGEWERMTEARSKIEGMLTSESCSDEEGEELIMLRNQLQAALDRMHVTLTDEDRVKEKLKGLEKIGAAGTKSGNVEDNDDDDDLFGDDEEEEDEAVRL